MDLNKAMVIGRLTRDPEIKVTPQGQNVSNFSVATNLRWTDTSGQRQEKVEYHNIVAWRKLAETCAQYLRKGSKVYIEGRLQTRDWEGQDGVKRYRTEIVADSMIMLDRAPSAGGYSAGSSPVASAPASPNLGEQQPVADTAIPEIQIEEEPVAPSTSSGDAAKPDAPKTESGSSDIKVENIPF